MTCDSCYSRVTLREAATTLFTSPLGRGSESPRQKIAAGYHLQALSFFPTTSFAAGVCSAAWSASSCACSSVVALERDGLEQPFCNCGIQGDKRNQSAIKFYSGPTSANPGGFCIAWRQPRPASEWRFWKLWGGGVIKVFLCSTEQPSISQATQRLKALQRRGG